MPRRESAALRFGDLLTEQALLPYADCDPDPISGPFYDESTTRCPIRRDRFTTAASGSGSPHRTHVEFPGRFAGTLLKDAR
jgi:hypothetical protein